ncbi:DUF2267 domain-containing protein [Roseibium sp.]|uniref:DUF2267 domain-containing protein n=1 Tax=Roseibium sp. TaxID=1936156 RepID=UPI003A981E31
MDELIQRIIVATGVNVETARQAVTIILNFLNKEAPQERMQEVFAALPGAEKAVNDYAGEKTGGGGLLGGLSGMVPGMGAMAVLGELSSAGLDMGEVQKVARELIEVAREKVGEDTINEVISSIPVLKQII